MAAASNAKSKNSNSGKSSSSKGKRKSRKAKTKSPVPKLQYMELPKDFKEIDPAFWENLKKGYMR